ncbi:hypothetical protein GGX14DRAFT_608648 [Mycena pura]|uniref:Uncharacterized protein n=1 Tax=Mycena pura TaxID=153505 RepID=A0AAD6VP55_9AGAR|nr:hypothetical protein GGX14DRAFT_608648 [Mycena pura]
MFLLFLHVLVRTSHSLTLFLFIPRLAASRLSLTSFPAPCHNDSEPDTDTEPTPEEALENQIESDLAENIRHTPVKVARHQSPFEDAEEEQDFLELLKEVLETDSLPEDYGILEDEWEEEDYPEIETIRPGRRAKELVIVLPRREWFPRAVQWTQALDFMTSMMCALSAARARPRRTVRHMGAPVAAPSAAPHVHHARGHGRTVVLVVRVHVRPLCPPCGRARAHPSRVLSTTRVGGPYVSTSVAVHVGAPSAVRAGPCERARARPALGSDIVRGGMQRACRRRADGGGGVSRVHGALQGGGAGDRRGVRACRRRADGGGGVSRVHRALQGSGAGSRSGQASGRAGGVQSKGGWAVQSGVQSKGGWAVQGGIGAGGEVQRAGCCAEGAHERPGRARALVVC